MMRPIRLWLVALGMVASSSVDAVADEERTVDELIQDLGSSSYRTQEEAAVELGRRGAKSKRAVPALIKLACEAGSRDEGEAAMRALGSIGPAAASAIPMMLDAMKLPGAKPVPTCKNASGSAAADAVGRLGSRAAKELVAATKRPEFSLEAYQAVDWLHALRIAGKSARGAIPRVRALCADGTHWDSCYAALAAMGAPVVPELVDALDTQMGLLSLEIIARLGPSAKAALPNVLPLIDTESDGTVCGWALLAAEQIAPRDKRVAEKRDGAKQRQACLTHYAIRKEKLESER